MTDHRGPLSEDDHGIPEAMVDLVLDTPDPPPDLLFAAFDDYRARALLAANGFGTSTAELRRVLGSTSSVLQGAAAHTAGSAGLTDLVPDVRVLEAESEDLVRVEAAYALVRLGEEDQAATLREALDQPVATHLGPPVAAGDLARWGDPVGFPVLEACLAEGNLIARVGGCKQLIHFVPFQGRELADGTVVDAIGLLERTTRDTDPEVARIARLQWDEVRGTPSS